MAPRKCVTEGKNHRNPLSGFHLLCFIALVFFSEFLVAQDSGQLPDEPQARYITHLAGSAETLDGKPAINALLRSGSIAMAFDSDDRLYFAESIIYYTDNDTAGPIYRVETNGTASLIFEEFRFSTFTISGDLLYLLSECTVRRYDLANERFLSDLPSGGCLTTLAVDSQGNAYTTNGRDISQTRPGAGTHTFFATGGVETELLEMDLQRDELLVWGSGQLVSISVDGRQTRKLAEDNSLNVTDLATDSAGNVYLAANESLIYRWSRETGELALYAGNGGTTNAGDGGPALDAGIQVSRLAVNSLDEVWFSFYKQFYRSTAPAIRKVHRRFDIVSTEVAIPGLLNCSSPSKTQFFEPAAIAVSEIGIVYLYAFGAILAIDPFRDFMFAVAGTYNVLGQSPDGTPALGSRINLFGGWNAMVVAPSGDILFTEENAIRKVDVETGLLGTVATGPYRTLDFNEEGRLFAYRSDSFFTGPGEIVEVDLETGESTVILQGGPQAWEESRSAVNRNLGLVWDIAVGAEGSLFVLSGSKLLKLEKDSWNVTLLHDSASNFDLDEKNNHLYYSSRGQINLHDLNSGDLFRIVGNGIPGNGSSNALEADVQPAHVIRTPDGDIYTLANWHPWRDEPEAFRIFRISRNPPEQFLAIPDEFSSGANIGRAVSGRENWLAIGVPNHPQENGSKGEVLVYQDNDCRPVLRDRLRAEDGTRSLSFGSHVAFVGDSLIIGSSDDSEESAVVRATHDEPLFRLGRFGLKDNQRWRFDRDLSGLLPADVIGDLVADDGRFAVGSPSAGNGQGEVTVFEIDDLDNPDTVRPSEPGTSGFGRSLAMKEESLAVGAGTESTRGSVEIFAKAGSEYEYRGSIESLGSNPDFAIDLAMNDDSLYVGAPHPDGGRVFDYSRSELSLFDTMADPDDPANASFGKSLAIEDGVLVVGAPDTSRSATQAADSGPLASSGPSIPQTVAPTGAVFAFGVKDGSGRKARGNLLFTLLAIAAEAYGEAVDIRDGRIIIGAPDTDNGRGTFDYAGKVVNASELSGLWYDPDQDGEGYNLLVAPNGLVVFFYGYDTSGERLWLISETVTGEIEFGQDIHVPIYKAMVGEFGAPVASSEGLVRYGLLSISFGSLRSATFTINGFDGNKISRSTFLADTSANNAAFSGLWFDPEKDGEGFNVISGQFVTVVYYYGSSSSGERLWLISDGMSNDIADGLTLSAKMYEAVGGDFLNPAPSSSSLRDWGTIEVQFIDCHRGRIVLTGADGNKTSEVIKLAGVAGAGCD